MKDGRSTWWTPTNQDGGLIRWSATNTSMGGTEQTEAEGATVCSGEGLHTETHTNIQESSQDSRKVKTIEI